MENNFLSIGSGGSQFILNKNLVDSYKDNLLACGTILFTDAGNYTTPHNLNSLKQLMKDVVTFKKFQEQGTGQDVYINLDRILSVEIISGNTRINTVNSTIEVSDNISTVLSKFNLKPTFKVESFTKGRLTSEKFYATDNGNGTYSDLVKEILYNYSGISILSKEEKYYDIDGSLQETKLITYFQNKSGDRIIKN